MYTLNRWEAPRLPFRREEIIRYAGGLSREAIPEGFPMEEMLKEAENKARCRGVWRLFELGWTSDVLDLGFAETRSLSLRRFLSGCHQAILFAITAGTEIDRWIAGQTLRSPLRGLLAHAIGAERVESACDALCEEFAKRWPGRTTAGRFSPGYGDLPLNLQQQVCAVLDCERYPGIRLKDNLLMTPAKSVTALVGLKNENAETSD